MLFILINKHCFIPDILDMNLLARSALFLFLHLNYFACKYKIATLADEHHFVTSHLSHHEERRASPN